MGSNFAHSNDEASVLVIETLFGWVSGPAAFEEALGDRAVAPAMTA